MATHLTVRAAGPITRHIQVEGEAPDFVDSIALKCDDGLVLEIELDDDVFIDHLADTLIDLLELRRRRHQSTELAAAEVTPPSAGDVDGAFGDLR